MYCEHVHLLGGWVGGWVGGRCFLKVTGRQNYGCRALDGLTALYLDVSCHTRYIVTSMLHLYAMCPLPVF